MSVAAGLVVGAAADQLFGDPRHGHPVAAFGRAAAALERRIYADRRDRGTVFTALAVGGTVALARLLPRRTAVVAAATWTVLGGRSLAAEGLAVRDLLAADDLPGARQRLTHLVGRDTSTLDAAGVSRAVVESLAENACDAVVAPLVWGAVAGVPGLLGYRAINTLDAMVGHRSPRYERFGWASARLDDLANLLPARVTALLVAAASPVVAGSPVGALVTARRDGRRHPSPNSGVSEAAFAGALGLRLGGRNVYGGTVDDRPVLGDGRSPVPADITRTARLLRAVTAAAALTTALAAAANAGRQR